MICVFGKSLMRARQWWWWWRWWRWWCFDFVPSTFVLPSRKEKYIINACTPQLTTALCDGNFSHFYIFAAKNFPFIDQPHTDFSRGLILFSHTPIVHTFLCMGEELYTRNKCNIACGTNGYMQNGCEIRHSKIGRPASRTNYFAINSPMRIKWINSILQCFVNYYEIACIFACGWHLLQWPMHWNSI